MGAEVRKPAVMLAWLQAYAAQTATTANYYRDLLVQLWLLDRHGLAEAFPSASSACA